MTRRPAKRTAKAPEGQPLVAPPDDSWQARMLAEQERQTFLLSEILDVLRLIRTGQ